jgi:hypothetical protein
MSVAVESGEITEIEELDDKKIIWFGDKDFAEMGISLYAEDTPYPPQIGDEVIVEGYDNPYGATLLKINGVVQYDRSDKEAQLLYAIRKYEQILSKLRQELEDERGR